MHQVSSQDIVITSLKMRPEYVNILAKWAFDTWGEYNPSASFEKTKQKFQEHLNEERLPLTYVALKKDRPIGMCSLRENDGIRTDLTPWLGSLFVEPEYRHHSIARRLIESIKQKAIEMHYGKLYLLTFDSTLPQWYERLGWKPISSEWLNNFPVTIMEIEL
ncbi:MAG: hypothetical protein BGO43_08385 [Gammaproteobacteria bacterium 39-13]|nr:GNAT family N-acetyltransferase [Gammaproteobacteria bacterium]OJV96468.1 MAG: hypothetical protein BGO43_08385 [Gammaproteobacteria bacterium 39-13]